MFHMNQVQGAVKTSALAIWSLVLGILGLLCFSFLAGIPAIICGHMGRSQIRQSNGTLGGEGLALAGLILGYAGTIITTIAMIGIIAAISIPQFVAYRNKANCAKAEIEASSALAAISCHLTTKNPDALPSLDDLAMDPECTYTPTESTMVEISGTIDQLQISVLDATGQCTFGDRYVISLPETPNDGWQQ